ncbi:MAG: efflux RND transporter periplasmic adaptor subunit [Pirellulales bacterium]
MNTTTASESSAPVKVVKTQPQRKNFVRTIDLPGRVEAFEVTPVFARVSGYVTSVPVDVGSKVSGPRDGMAGTILCEIDSPDLREDVLQKQAVVEQAQAEILQAEAAVRLAQAAQQGAAARVAEAEAAAAREDAQLARWESELARVKKLAETGVVTQKVADETLSERDAAAAGRREVTAKIESVRAELAQAVAASEKATADAAVERSKLKVAEAELRRVQTMAAFSHVTAPFDGIVTRRDVHTGHLVSAGSNATSLLTVMRTDKLRIIVDIPETDAVLVQPGTKVDIRVPALSADPKPAVVTRTSWSLDNVSRTMTAEIDVSGADPHWRAGSFVNVKLTTAEKENTLVVSKTAIQTVDKQTVCGVVQADGSVTRKPIQLGLQSGAEWEVLSGITESDNIVPANLSAFRDGQKVELVTPIGTAQAVR